MGTVTGEAYHAIRRKQSIELDGHTYAVPPTSKIVLTLLRDAPEGRIVTQDQLAAALWPYGSGPENERGNIGQVLFKTRNLVGRGSIVNVFLEGWYLDITKLSHNLEAGHDD